jgi:hypothetical protein
MLNQAINAIEESRNARERARIASAVRVRDAQAAYALVIVCATAKLSPVAKSALRVWALQSLRVKHYRAGGKEVRFNPTRDEITAELAALLGKEGRA